MSEESEPDHLDEDDCYRDSVMMVKTPVTVTLARKTETLNRIMNLVPGSMLTFEVGCDELLTLEAGEQPIAQGETVKIGDKFGIRVRNLLTEDDLGEN